jgi:PPOX class probable F420-dependent enzyme
MLASGDVTLFLDRELPAMLGVVGTLLRDGSPHVVPVWYRYDGQRVHIWTIDSRLWVKNLLRDNRVAFSVQEEQEPFGAVMMRGRAEVVTNDGDEVSAEIRRITRRYIQAPEVENYVSHWLHLRTIVSITPHKITAWGKGY